MVHFPLHSFKGFSCGSFFNVKADELLRGLNDNLERVLDMDFFQEIVDRFGKPDIDLFASRLNYSLKNTLL